MKKAQIILFSTTLVALSIYEMKRDIKPQKTQVAKSKAEKKIVKTVRKHVKKT